ncbi:hypothetical protein [Rubrimonas cliftonensis]|uniref:Protein ImuA n=1 Tax=Rubrimonas cliftonensis TaxID=89524 RepID=A0A1H3VWH6_9RHOB|nr:hypothetical protein [Rubrimonas cliftonensis]SDZ79110.1 protein ImuA [Rubrimonas cliftonensis]
MIRRRLPMLSLAGPGAPMAGAPALALGRAHEVAGPGRRAFAAMVAGALSGPVLWVRGPWREERLNPEGLRPFFNPARLVTVEAPSAIEALWAAEEALRSGAAPLVALEPAAPPALTPVRRLQLAAEAGGALDADPGREARDGAGRAPLCLILLPEGGAAAAVETRWWIDPAPGWAAGQAGAAEGPARWRLRLLRDKGGPPGAWRATAPGGLRPHAPPRYEASAA